MKQISTNFLAYTLAVAETTKFEIPELILHEHIQVRLNHVRELTEEAHFELRVSMEKNTWAGYKSADSSFFSYKRHLAMTE